MQLLRVKISQNKLLNNSLYLLFELDLLNIDRESLFLSNFIRQITLKELVCHIK